MFKMYVKFAESLKHLVVIVRFESGISYSDKIAEDWSSHCQAVLKFGVLKLQRTFFSLSSQVLKQLGNSSTHGQVRQIKKAKIDSKIGLDLE